MIMEALAALFGLGMVAFGLNKAGWVTLPGNQNVGTYRFDYSLDDFAPATPIRKNIRNLSLSPAGREFIKSKEGFSATPYRDSAGVATIGYGTTRGVTMGSKAITPQEADHLMEGDIERFHRELVQLVKVPLAQNEYDALMSFIYNLGASNLASSTLLRRLNAGEYTAAADEFLRWVYAGGRKLAGLVTRRKQEKEIFLA